MDRKRPLTNNWISLMGLTLAVIFMVGEALILALNVFNENENPYAGILIYMVGPAILVTGLFLVPFGMWLEHRRRSRGIGRNGLPILDFNEPSHRRRALIFLALTIVFLTLSIVGTYRTYHFTESVSFCGKTCHQVMTPEFVAYGTSPHARVACVDCHIGAGADWFVKSKLSGAQQVIAVLRKSYTLPIETPLENLRPARETCEQCHWPEKFYTSFEKTMVFYGSDEQSTPYAVDLLLHVGKRRPGSRQPGGIHWHIGIDHKLEYYAKDAERMEIPWVRVTYRSGVREVFIDEGDKDFDPASIPGEAIRVMDCMDCHNRPSHHYLSPSQAVNEAMMAGFIDPGIPGIKSASVEALQGAYKTTPEALGKISQILSGKYKALMGADPSMKAPVLKAIAQVRKIFEKNLFPEWKVDWSKYPTHIGHFEFPGCYRCHDDKHTTKNGKSVSNDCNLCHIIVRQGEGTETVGNLKYSQQDFVHPRGMEDAWQGQACHECHGPGMM